MEEIKNEPCPFCNKKTLTLIEKKKKNSYFFKNYFISTKSAKATIKIPTLRMDVRPGIGSIAYISNIEGVIRRFKKIIENQRDSAEDDSVKKHAKNLLKKLWKVENGEEELKIIIEDPSGNSAIISDKAEVSKLKK